MGAEADDLRSRLDVFESSELVDKVRNGHLTSDAEAVAREILRARRVNIPLSVDLQQKKQFQTEEAKARELWRSGWLYLLHLIAGFTVVAAIGFVLRGALVYLVAMFFGMGVSTKLSRTYIAREDIGHQEKVRTLKWMGIFLFVLQAILFALRRAIYGST